MQMNHGGTMELEQLTAMTILVIDKSEQDHFKILEQLEQLERAGHRVVHAGANQDSISGLLEHRSHLAMSTVLAYDGITVDQEQRRVHVHGTPLTLSRLEFELLMVLIESPMRVHTHGEREQCRHRADTDH